jgi:site-specific DNA-methyltransferase (adenine-specific)
MNPDKIRAPRNKTMTLSIKEKELYKKELLKISTNISVSELENKTINQDLFEVLDYLPNQFIDLLFVDPPYNLTKNFNGNTFKEMPSEQYEAWIELWIAKLLPTLKETASIYICGDWKSSGAIQKVAEKYFKVRNRITWEREKGRGAKNNWKNNTEDIWFCTVSDKYIFNVEDVKLKKKIIAPYTNENGEPKDWVKSDEGDYRLTYPSNIWTDISIPYWSMPENTDHPTQKPEKLLAKIILASSNKGDFIFDPFLGAGTTSVVAKKIDRRFGGVEIDETYACLVQKRLHKVELDKTIQGYHDGVFWERNSLKDQMKISSPRAIENREVTFSLFEIIKGA